MTRQGQTMSDTMSIFIFRMRTFKQCRCRVPRANSVADPSIDIVDGRRRIKLQAVPPAVTVTMPDGVAFGP